MRYLSKSFVQWVERLLWIVAAATLGVSLWYIGDGRIQQWYLQWQFNDALAARELSTNLQQRTEPLVSDLASIHADMSYLGRLEIPRLQMSVMLLEGVDNRTLRRGIGHIPGTALPGQSGNIGIAGHRDTYFRALAGIRQEDQITVETLSSEYRYIVDSISIVDPDAVEVLRNSDRPALTLVTCYPFYFVGPAPKRFIVHASLRYDRLVGKPFER